jgi:hypothetical protein
MFARPCLILAAVQLFCLGWNLPLYSAAVYEQPFPLYCYFAINTGATVWRFRIHESVIVGVSVSVSERLIVGVSVSVSERLIVGE